MTDERRKAAEEWEDKHCIGCGRPKATEEDWSRCQDGCECDKCQSVCFDEIACMGSEDAWLTCHLAGQECGEQRVTKRIMRWLQLDGTIWTADNAADAIIEGIMTEVWRGYDGEDE